MIERRVIAVPISNELLIQMMRQVYLVEHDTKTIAGVPVDALFVSSFTNHRWGYLVFTHPDFDIVPLGADIPIKDVVFQTQDYPVEAIND